MAGKGREGSALLLGRCLRKSTPDQRIWGKGGEKQLLFTSLFQFFTLAWVRSEVYRLDRGLVIDCVLSS